MDSLAGKTLSPASRVIMGDCLTVLREQCRQGMQYDAIISDPPYEIGLHGQAADKTGVAFSSELWALLFGVLKPGGFVAAFAASRKFHRISVAAEDAGFILHPFLTWRFQAGLPKPVNVSELFDRDSGIQRRVIGYRDGSGFTFANVEQGAQRRTRTEFAVRERHVSNDARAWAGYYYGLNALAPSFEPILLAQRPIAAARVIDNIREFGTGALNIGALQRARGAWPTTSIDHRKAKRADHGSNHASVKPTEVMETLCLLACPSGGHIIDPFAGTGTTGVAAIQNGYSITLIEQNPELEPIIRRRLAMVERNGSLEASSGSSHVTIPKGIRRKARVTPPEVIAAQLEKNRDKVTAYRNRLGKRRHRSVQLWIIDTAGDDFAVEANRQAELIAVEDTGG